MITLLASQRSTRNFNFTIPSGDAKILVVNISYQRNPIAGVTFDGLPLTEAVETVVGIQRIGIWYLLNPPEKQGLISVSGTGILNVDALVYSGVDQISPVVSTVNPPASTNTAISITVNNPEFGSMILFSSFTSGGSVGLVEGANLRLGLNTRYSSSDILETIVGENIAVFNYAGAGYWRAFAVVVFRGMGIPFGISGSVKNQGAGVENASVFCMKQSNNELLPIEKTDENGNFMFEYLEENEKFHLFIEYEKDGVKYNAPSLWDISPYELE